MKIAITYPPLFKEGKYPLLGQNRQFRYSTSNEVKIYPVVPATAATLLKNVGFDVLYLDGINERLSNEQYMEQLYGFDPDVVVLETKTPVIKEHWKFINQVKKEKNIKFVLVGDHVTALPEESLLNSEVDFIVTGGDYDLGILKLTEYLNGKNELPKGAYYRENGRIKNTGKFELTEDLDILPYIDRDLTKWKIYGEAYLYRPCTYIMTGRGCSGFKAHGVCKFCVWQHVFWRCNARLRSPTNVVNEIKELVERYKIKEIFDDNDSGAIWNKKWLQQFYLAMKEESLIDKVILSSNARADCLDRETCELLKKIGYRLLKIGLESGNDETLKRLNKLESVEDIKRGVKNAKDYGLNIMLTIMVGYPWENEEDVKRTFQVARELMLYKTKFGDSLQASVIIPYPGTPLYKEALEKNWFIQDPNEYEKYDMSGPVLKSSIDPMNWCDKMWRIHQEPIFVLKTLFSIRSFGDMALLFRGAKSIIGHTKDF